MSGLLDGTQQSIYDATEFVGGEMNGDKWMRQGDFKALMVIPPFGTGVWQLFDLKKDPGEARDLSEQMPEKLEMLKNAWNQYADDVGVVSRE